MNKVYNENKLVYEWKGTSIWQYLLVIVNDGLQERGQTGSLPKMRISFAVIIE